jgi:hypothetical protein
MPKSLRFYLAGAALCFISAYSFAEEVSEHISATRQAAFKCSAINTNGTDHGSLCSLTLAGSILDRKSGQRNSLGFSAARLWRFSHLESQVVLSGATSSWTTGAIAVELGVGHNQIIFPARTILTSYYAGSKRWQGFHVGLRHSTYSDSNLTMGNVGYERVVLDKATAAISSFFGQAEFSGDDTRRAVGAVSVRLHSPLWYQTVIAGFVTYGNEAVAPTQFRTSRIMKTSSYGVELAYELSPCGAARVGFERQNFHDPNSFVDQSSIGLGLCF